MSRRSKLVLAVATALVLGLFLYQVRVVLLPFLLAGAFAYLVNPLVNAIARRSVPRVFAIFLAYLILAAGIVLVWYVVVPPLRIQMQEIAQTLPQQALRLQQITHEMLRRLRSLGMPPTMQSAVDMGIQRLEAVGETAAAHLANWVLGAASGVAIVVLVPILGFYVLRDVDLLRARVLGLLPPALREEAVTVGREIDTVVFGFIRGQFIVSLMVGALAGLGLAILGIPYALVLGALVAVFDVIPYVGPILGALPAVLLGLARSPITALYVTVLILVVHQFEGTVLSPKVVGDNVGLHPLVIIFAVLAGGDLFGLLGMLFAVPVAAALKVVATYLCRRLTGSFSVE